MKTIKIEILGEEGVNTSYLTDHNSYPETGFYLIGSDVYFVNKIEFFALWIGRESSFDSIIQEKEKEKGTVSESFALKLVAVASGYIEKLDLSDDEK